MELANWRPPHLFPSALTMRPLFTELIRPATSIFTTSTSVAASVFAASVFAASVFAASVFAASVFAASVFAASIFAASAIITEETADDESNDIPRSPRASAADDCLAEVEQYLQLLTRPQGLSDAEFRKFMQYSSGFSFSNSKLWQHNTHRKHKIVVPKEKRYELLKEVHDILEHKKIYAVRMQLLE
jgi:hypothetical protein